MYRSIYILTITYIRWQKIKDANKNVDKTHCFRYPLKQSFLIFFQDSPLKKFKKLKPPPTKLLKKLPLKIPKTFFFFLSTTPKYQCEFQIIISWPPCGFFVHMAPKKATWPTLGAVSPSTSTLKTSREEVQLNI